MKPLFVEKGVVRFPFIIRVVEALVMLLTFGLLAFLSH